MRILKEDEVKWLIKEQANTLLAIKDEDAEKIKMENLKNVLGQSEKTNDDFVTAAVQGIMKGDSALDVAYPTSVYQCASQAREFYKMVQRICQTEDKNKFEEQEEHKFDKLNQEELLREILKRLDKLVK